MEDRAPAPRASDRDRETVVQQLREAVADGRLSFGEFEDRIGGAYVARTRTDLDHLVADLPDGRRPRVVAEIHCNMSYVERRGRWDVPPEVSARLTGSSAKLDFSEADLPDAVDLAISMSASSMQVVVPDGAAVDLSGLETSMGSVSDRTRAEAPPTRTFTLHGRVSMSSLTVKNPSTLTRWWHDFVRRLRAS